MNKDLDRLPAGRRLVEVQLLDFGWAVGQAQRRAQPRANQFVVGRRALSNLLPIRRLTGLVIGRIELDLVVIEEDLGTPAVRRRPDTLLSERGRA